ncbi:MAG: hypothetical protein ACXAC2_00605 [Candidatus Kariarchaeaceae archaeon]|jgi:hypothetical protein
MNGFVNCLTIFLVVAIAILISVILNDIEREDKKVTKGTNSKDREKLFRMSTKIIGSSDGAKSFIKYLSEKQVDVNPLIRSEDLLVERIMYFRNVECKD